MLRNSVDCDQKQGQNAKSGVCKMDQVMRNGPENPLGDFVTSKDARHVRAMGIHEHASLVGAIMLNFPEIYEKPVDLNQNGQPGAHDSSGPAIQPTFPV
jgi:hypothetical protein